MAFLCQRHDGNLLFPQPRPSPATGSFVFGDVARAGVGGRWPYSRLRPPAGVWGRVVAGGHMPPTGRQCVIPPLPPTGTRDAGPPGAPAARRFLGLSIKNRMPGRFETKRHPCLKKPSMVLRRLTHWMNRHRVRGLVSIDRACGGGSLAGSVGLKSQTVAQARGRLSTGEIVQQRIEAGHLLAEQFQPGLWLPDLNADHGTNQHHFRLGSDVQELAETFRDNQARTPGQLHRPRPGRQQPAQPLHVSPPLLHPPQLNLLPNQLNPRLQSALPVCSPPEAEASCPLLDQDDIPFGTADWLGQLRRERDPVAVINDPPVLTRDECLRRFHVSRPGFASLVRSKQPPTGGARRPLAFELEHNGLKTHTQPVFKDRYGHKSHTAGPIYPGDFLIANVRCEKIVATPPPRPVAPIHSDPDPRRAPQNPVRNAHDAPVTVSRIPPPDTAGCTPLSPGPAGRAHRSAPGSARISRTIAPGTNGCRPTPVHSPTVPPRLNS